ncbi:MAG TPA: lipopolysaccharide biosynthesis protein [Actinobacteria bacterium]|nr:lipopolysaccharide biosynthesis protein [Actinomycetota bacterium]
MMRRIRAAWYWLMHPEGSLTNRAVNAGVWAFALTMTVRGLRTVRVIVLARLLSPDDFGLMGIALLTLAFLNAFTNTGFDKALIQREGDIRGHLDAAWTVSILRGFLIGGIVIAGAPIVAGFFHTAAAIGILRVMGASLVISGFKNVGVVYFDRDLQFRQRFIYQSIPQIIDLVIAVIAAIILHNVWALVFGVVARQISMTFASYLIHPYRPHLNFDRKKMGELLSFGIWIFGSAILSYFSANLDDIVVGRVLDATMLGFYTTAYTLSSFTSQQMTGVITEVAFPAFSKLQNDKLRLRSAYLRTLRAVALLAFPVAAGLWFVGPQLVGTFMGAKWLPLIPAFNVLLLWGLLRSIGSTTSPLLFAAGRPDINTKLHLVTVVLLAVVIYPFTTTGGIVGAAWATIVAGLFPVGYLLLLTGRFLEAPRWTIFRTLIIPIAAALLMLIVLVVVRDPLGATSSRWLLVWSPALGAAVYGAAILLAQRFLHYSLRF